MAFHIIRAICFLLLAACVNHHHENTSIRASLETAGALCHQGRENMEWLEQLILEFETNPGLRGDIYAVSLDGAIIFVHQPVVMSCLGCVLYDCNGTKIATASVDHAKVQKGMKPSNRIYTAF